MPCATCDGSGEVLHEKNAQKDEWPYVLLSEPIKKACPDCRGSGRTPEEESEWRKRADAPAKS